MGYCARMNDAVFTIKADKAKDALHAIQNLDPTVGGGREYCDGKMVKSFSWVDTEEMQNAKNLGEAFNAWGWELTVDENGDWADLTFNADKVGDEIHLFKAVAPYLEAGSYIEMSGEDGGTWRWMFDGTTCEEVEPKLSWDE